MNDIPKMSPEATTMDVEAQRLMRADAHRAIETLLSISENPGPLAVASYVDLVEVIFPEKPTESIDVFNAALRRDPLCQGPYKADHLILGDLPKKGRSAPEQVERQYAGWIGATLIMNPYKRTVVTRDALRSILAGAHQDKLGTHDFALPYLSHFLKRITEGKVSTHAELAGGHILNTHYLTTLPIVDRRGSRLAPHERAALLRKVMRHKKLNGEIVMPVTFIKTLVSAHSEQTLNPADIVPLFRDVIEDGGVTFVNEPERNGKDPLNSMMQFPRIESGSVAPPIRPRQSLDQKLQSYRGATTTTNRSKRNQR